jgi:GNAT superfamily N-acetyltransferase
MQEVKIKSIQEQDLDEAITLLHMLNPNCQKEELYNRCADILKNHPHYFMIGAFIENQMVGLAGVWIATKIWCGKYLEIDHLVTHLDYRNKGIATKMMDHLEKIAVDHQCNITVLDSYTANFESHRLYHKKHYEIWGFHFIKKLRDFSH